MNISAIACKPNVSQLQQKRNIAFGDGETAQQPTVKPEVKEKKKGGFFKGLASTFIPGLGQACDGRTSTGAKFFGAAAGLWVAKKALGSSYMKDVAKLMTENVLPKAAKYKYAGIIAASVLSAGVWIANIVDAYKGGKKQA